MLDFAFLTLWLNSIVDLIVQFFTQLFGGGGAA